MNIAGLTPFLYPIGEVVSCAIGVFLGVTPARDTFLCVKLINLHTKWRCIEK